MHNDPTETPGQDAQSLSSVLRDCLEAGVINLDADRRILLLNARAARLCGFPVSDRPPAAPGSAPVAQTPAASALPAPLRRVVDESFRGGEGTRQIQLATDGEERLVQVSSNVVRAANGRISGVTLVLNDLSAARVFEQTLNRLDRLASIGTLSAGMAHEIKNAMVAVKTFVDLLIQKNRDSQLAEVVDREMVRINAIVSQMLRFAGPARPTFSNLRIHELLEQSLQLVQHHLEGQKVTVQRSLGATPDAVRGDGYQLEQVFLNLFFNALEAMGPNGCLTIATEAIPAEQSELDGTPALRVSVQDSGVGIPPENLGRLFEPFFTTKPNGTGLGLPITRRIVQEHRGVIRVDSRPGEGATFHILLPLAGTPGIAP